MKHRRERTEHKLKQYLELFFESEVEDDLLLEASVVRVSCSSDLRHARVGIFHPQGKQVKKALLESARALQAEIREYIGDRISGRFVPEFSFVFDDSENLIQTIESLGIPVDSEEPVPE
jgi:ribosome-binding factor A